MKKPQRAPRRTAAKAPAKPTPKPTPKPRRRARAAPGPAGGGARTRKATNLTLSDQAKAMGRIIAEARGMNFSQLVEQLVRDEMRRHPTDQ